MRPKKNLYDDIPKMETCGVIDRPLNPIESMEKEISMLRDENQRLRNECLDLYRRLDN
jgi:regulator of replication initiation timing